MNEALNETSLESQTHGCCEGARRPFSERKNPSQCVVQPIDLKDIHIAWIDYDKAKAAELEEAIEGIGLASHLEELTAERGEVYGPYDINMYGTALQISGMLAQFYQRTDLPVLPAYMAAMIMTAYKSNRMVRTPDHEDSHIDDANYKRFAKELGRQIAESVG